MITHKRVQMYIKLPNFGLSYFESIKIADTSNEKWQQNLAAYIVQRERYERWTGMYGTGPFITVGFNADFTSGRDLVMQAYRLMTMAAEVASSGCNPFLGSNWENQKYLPGTCIHDDPESAIAHLHAFITSVYDSALSAHVSTGTMFFDLLNRELYNVESNILTAGIFSRLDSIANNDGVLLVDFILQKYCFMNISEMSTALNPAQDKDLFSPVDYKVYLNEFNPEVTPNKYRIPVKSFLPSQAKETVAVNKKKNKPFHNLMKDFKVLSHKEVIAWFPAMEETIKSHMSDVMTKYNPGKRPTLEFVDAQDMAAKNKLTVIAPTPESLFKIKPDTSVKVCAIIPKEVQTQLKANGLNISTERFWVKVINVEKDGTVTGTINNDVFYLQHQYKNIIKFNLKNVFNIL
jgi:hypothetical protein